MTFSIFSMLIARSYRQLAAFVNFTTEWFLNRYFVSIMLNNAPHFRLKVKIHSSSSKSGAKVFRFCLL